MANSNSRSTLKQMLIELPNAANLKGDEPLIDAQGINMQWGKSWPRIIAKAWHIQHNGPATEIERVWLEYLLSGKPELVREALEMEGFAPRFKVFTKSDNNRFAYDNDFDWFWNNIAIVVKKAEDGANLVAGDTRRLEKNGMIIDTQQGGVEYKFEPNKIECMAVSASSPEKVMVSTNQNGWKDESHRLKHLLILTLPPKPEQMTDSCLAITDYEAKGLVYPFTICCC